MVELCVMRDEKHIRPILVFQNFPELALVVPFRGVVGGPFDRGAVRDKTLIANVRLGRELR
jgi:hypothetical protein